MTIDGVDRAALQGGGARAWLRRWRRSAIMQAISANVAIQAAQSFAQLALVPVFATHWGLSAYGAWLLLFTVPAYIAMADLGLGSAAGNDMTAKVARGEQAGATAVYQALRVVGLLSGAIAILIAMLTLYGIAPHLLDGLGGALGADARPVAITLALYGAVGLQTGVVAAGYRAVGAYALSSYIFAAMVAIEAAGALALVVAGSRPAMVAFWYLGLRTAMMAVLAAVLARHAPWLVTWRWRSSLRVLRHLLRPAAAVMILPAALALSIQGTVVVIGAVLGSAAVPAFTAVRTLSRVAVQAVLMVNHALMPSMTAARAVEAEERVTRLATVSFLVSLSLVVPAAAILLVGGRRIVGVWTHGALHPELALLAIMAAIMVLNAIWAPAANLILSINRHEGYTWFFLVVSAGGLGLCVPLTTWLGLAGAALSLLAVEAVMLLRIAALSRRLRLFDPPAVAAMVRSVGRRYAAVQRDTAAGEP